MTHSFMILTPIVIHHARIASNRLLVRCRGWSTNRTAGRVVVVT